MSELVLISTLVFIAGVYLIWQSREEMIFWMREYLRFLRQSMQQPAGTPAPPLGLRQRPDRSHQTMRIVLGFFLAFCVAPILLSLVFFI